MEEPPWIYRDQNDNIRSIDLSKKGNYVRIVIQLMYYFHEYLFPICSLFPINQTISSKISGFMKHFNINNKFINQCGFAVIELKEGSSTLIGPFKPVNVSEKKHLLDIDHSEEQCIREIKKEIKGKEKMTKAIYIFTKYSPCFCRKDRDSCMIQLVRFSEEMYSYNIEVVIAFQDFYGASGNIVKELKVLMNDEDPSIKKALLGLKENMKEQHRRSTFICFHGNKHKKRSSIKTYITDEIRKYKISNTENVERFLSQNNFKMEFLSKKMTLNEFKKFGEEQAHKLKTHLKNQNVSEEIREKACLLFYSKWCELVYEEYEEFIYKKLSDYINSFAVRIAYDNIKAITNHFHLERVK